jgi:hypothetical protein
MRLFQLLFDNYISARKTATSLICLNALAFTQMLQIKVAVLSQNPVLHVVVSIRPIKGTDSDFKQFSLIRLSNDRNVFETHLPQQVYIILPYWIAVMLPFFCCCG